MILRYNCYKLSGYKGEILWIYYCAREIRNPPNIVIVLNSEKSHLWSYGIFFLRTWN